MSSSFASRTVPHSYSTHSSMESTDRYSSQYRPASTRCSDTIFASPYDSPSNRSRHAEPRHFPGPLRIPETPRFASAHNGSSPMPSSRSSHPPPSHLQPPWNDTRLPPIRDYPPSPTEMSSAHWHEKRHTVKPAQRYLDSPTSSQPSSPEDADYFPATKKEGYPRYEYPARYYSREGTPMRHGDSHYMDVDDDKHIRQESTKSRSGKGYDAERVHHSQHAPLVDSFSQRPKFGVRRGSRFFCTYVSPGTGARCEVWDKGWTVYATLNRHAETEHAPEELGLLDRGKITYDQAQIVTSKDKREKVEENLARTGKCEDCGTVFSSGRRDSLTRHKQTNACEKAQKRNRPPTKFPKKPKGSCYQVMETDSEDDSY